METFGPVVDPQVTNLPYLLNIFIEVLHVSKPECSKMRLTPFPLVKSLTLETISSL